MVIVLVTSTSLNIATINTKGLTVTGFVDLLLDDKLKDQGRRHKFQSERQRSKDKKAIIEKLNKVTKLLSGQLADNNLWR
jgi:hypothetical protein